jgi:hypothetical protein
MVYETKVRLARAQLGTALDLFMRDRDPISVHVLASGAAEVLEGVALASNVRPFSSHILSDQPTLNMTDIRRLRNQYWNAMKHFYGRDNKSVRDDEDLIRDFSDVANDTALFLGWHDFQAVTGTLPIGAQVFQIWYYASNEEKLAPEADRATIREFFPEIASQDRAEQKRRLRRAVEKFRNDKALLADQRTDPSQLSPRRSA